jgi:hypothetical protein
MKRKATVYFAAILALSVALAAQAAAAKLVWDASTGTVTGYRVYYSTTAGSFSADRRAEAGTATEYNIDLLPLSQGVEYHMVVTAYNSAGESGYSNSVSYTPPDTTPPATPTGVAAN